MSSTMDRTQQLGRGTVAGVVAFVAGYLVTYLWQASQVREALAGMNAILQFFGGEQIPAWKAVGWLFFNAHFVRTQIPGLGGPQTRNFIAQGDFPALLYAIPVILLLAAGFFVAWTLHLDDVQASAMSGAMVAVGYGLTAILALFAVGATRGDASISPDPVTGILLAGIVYPLVLAGIGGALAGLVDSSNRPASETTTN